MKAWAGRLTLGLCLASLWAGDSGAVTRYVSLNGTNDSGHGFTNWVGAATNIQDAIAASSNDDTILVSNGTYAVASGDQVVNISVGVNIQGVYGRDITIIDGSGVRRCVSTSISSTGSPVYLSGFTIRNGAWNSQGAGLMIGGYRNTYLTDCVISNNISTVAGSGGGIHKRYAESTLVVSNCVVVNNQAPSGAGIYQERGTSRWFNCVIGYNTASSSGGGFFGPSTMGVSEFQSCQIVSNLTAAGGGFNIQVKESDSPGGRFVANNCTIAGNSATNSTGGGVHLRDWVSAAYISNCVIQKNEAYTTGGGVYVGGGGRITDCLIAGNTTLTSVGGGMHFACPFLMACDNLTIVTNVALGNNGGGLWVASGAIVNFANTIIYGNKGASDATRDNVAVYGTTTTFTNSCTIPLTQVVGSGNITNNPSFVDLAGGKYQLQRGSPCINTGTNQDWMTSATDLDGRSRLDYFSRCVDMGAYEYVPVGAMFLAR